MRNKKGKKAGVIATISIMAALLVMMGMPTQRGHVSGEGAIWDGTIATAFAGGDGLSEESAFEISNGSELAYFSELINAGKYNTEEYYFKITEDIVLNDMAHVSVWGEGIAPVNNWMPIGNAANPFCGAFDGNGKTIAGIYICTGEDYNGLFGAVSGTVSSVTVGRGYIKGGAYTGGVAGKLGGFGAGTVARVSNCENNAKVNGTDYTGGIVGKVEGAYEIEGCINNRAVVSDSMNADGISCGVNEEGGNINNGSVFGNKLIKDLGAGNVIWDGTEQATAFAGGTGTAKDPYLISTPAQLYFLSVVVKDTTHAEHEKYNAEGVTYKLTRDIFLNNTDGAENWGSNLTNLNKWLPIGQYNVNVLRYPFRGNFDGDGYAVRGLYFQNTDWSGGLFGCAVGSTIKNLSTEQGAAITQNACRPGALIGAIQNGKIENCYNTMTEIGYSLCVFTGGIAGWVNSSTVSYCYNTGVVQSNANNAGTAGGVVGYADGTNSRISNCYNAGEVSGGIGNIGNYFGGVAGALGANVKMENCFNIGEVFASRANYGVGGITGNTVETSAISGVYNAGAVSGPVGKVGDLIGRYLGGTLEQVYYTETENIPVRAENVEVPATVNDAACEFDDKGALHDGSKFYNGFNAWYDTEGKDGLYFCPTFGGTEVPYRLSEIGNAHIVRFEYGMGYRTVMRTVKSGSFAEVPQIIPEGYEFDGWFTDPAFGADAAWNPQTAISDNLVVYALLNHDCMGLWTVADGVFQRICELCGETQRVTVTTGASLTLEDEISLNYRMSLTKNSEFDADVTAQILIYENLTDMEPTVVDMSEVWVGQYKAVASVYAAKDAVKTHFVQFKIVVDGTEFLDAKKEYSPAIWATNMLEKDTSSVATKHLALAFLDYISAAQTYFQTGDILANAQIDEAVRAVIDDYRETLVVDTSGEPQTYGNFPYSIGLSLNLESKVSINGYVNTSGEGKKVTMSIYENLDDAQSGVNALDNVELLFENGETAVYKGKTSLQFVAKDFNKVLYIAFKVIETDGQIHTGIISYGINIYANSMLAKDNTTEDMRRLCNELLEYFVAASNYFMIEGGIR